MLAWACFSRTFKVPYRSHRSKSSLGQGPPSVSSNLREGLALSILNWRFPQPLRELRREFILIIEEFIDHFFTRWSHAIRVDPRLLNMFVISFNRQVTPIDLVSLSPSVIANGWWWPCISQVGRVFCIFKSQGDLSQIGRLTGFWCVEITFSHLIRAEASESFAPRAPKRIGIDYIGFYASHLDRTTRWSPLSKLMTILSPKLWSLWFPVTDAACVFPLANKKQK